MTTAKTRRPGTTAGPQRGASAKKSGKAREPIPVLIRLPELRIEPETKADGLIPPEDEASRVAIPLLATPADSLRPPAAHAELSRPDAAAIAGGEPALAAVPSPVWHRPSWSEFRLPRWAVHGGIALGLIAVLVVAYFAIAGRSTKSDTTLTEDRMTSPADQPPSTVPPVVLSAPPGPVAEPAAPGRAGKEPEAAKQAEPAGTLLELQAEAAGSNLSQPPQQAAEAVGSPPPAAVQAQTSSTPQAVIPQGPALTAAAADAPRADTPAEAPPPADADSRSPLAAGAPAGEGGVAGDVPRYPVTNPATFQYPPEYHLRLQKQTRGGASLNTGAASGGAGQDDWQPSTARLQPRIEPPPVR